MRQNNDLSRLLLYVAVIGAFISAVVLGAATQSSDHLIGFVLIVVGVAAIVFARSLASTQHRLAETPFIPENWKDVRPFTFVLWGVGVAIVGIALVWIL